MGSWELPRCRSWDELFMKLTYRDYFMTNCDELLSIAEFLTESAAQRFLPEHPGSVEASSHGS